MKFLEVLFTVDSYNYVVEDDGGYYELFVDIVDHQNCVTLILSQGYCQEIP